MAETKEGWEGDEPPEELPEYPSTPTAEAPGIPRRKIFLNQEEQNAMGKVLAPRIVPAVETMHAELEKASLLAVCYPKREGRFPTCIPRNRDDVSRVYKERRHRRRVQKSQSAVCRWS